MTFKLTPTTKHYVNAEGDRVEVALLGALWFGVVIRENQQLPCMYSESGLCLWTLHLSNAGEMRKMNLVKEFEGWLSNPFEGAPEWVTHATAFGWHASQPGLQWINDYRGPDPTGCAEVWISPSMSRRESDTKYIGDWRNSLVERKECTQ